jgi:hypothetical protein
MKGNKKFELKKVVRTSHHRAHNCAPVEWPMLCSLFSAFLPIFGGEIGAFLKNQCYDPNLDLHT